MADLRGLIARRSSHVVELDKGGQPDLLVPVCFRADPVNNMVFSSGYVQSLCTILLTPRVWE